MGRFALWAVVLDDLGANEWVSNIGITIFALPLVILGATGGRLAQRVGPFRLGSFGLVLGAGFMFLYGVMPTALAMLAVGVVHSIFDGLTVSSTGVATGLVISHERQASAQGMIGAVETLTAAVAAVSAGVLYEHHGRFTAYTVCALVMVGLAAAAFWLAGPEWRARRGAAADEPESKTPPPDIDLAVTGHA